MTSRNQPETIEENQRLLEAMGRYRSEIDAGRVPNREALLAEYSDVADELAGCLDSLDFLHQVAPELGGEPDAGGHQRSEQVRPLACLGDFRIVREIGRGGMGVVYEAEQLSLGRHVALKVLPFAAMLNQRQLQRFKNEAQAAAMLRHPNVFAVHAVGCERGVHFYATDLVEGISLAAVIHELREKHLANRTSNAPTQRTRCEIFPFRRMFLNPQSTILKRRSTPLRLPRCRRNTETTHASSFAAQLDLEFRLLRPWIIPISWGWSTET
jgi:hypothetical protein